MTDDRLTPLMLAARNNRPEMARVLLDAGADPTRIDMERRTAEDIAVQEGNDHIAELIRQYER